MARLILTVQSLISQQVFVEVESYEMANVEDDKSANHGFPGATSEPEHDQKVWEGSDVKNKSVASVV